MSMLRYVRMHTLAPGAHPSASSSSPSVSKLYRIFADWLCPLNAYAVPHRSPAETAAHTCRCRYPLYTFCAPTNSPFNDMQCEPVATSGIADVSVCTAAGSSAGVATADAITGVEPVSILESTLSPSATGHGAADDQHVRRDSGEQAKLIHMSMEAVGRRKAPHIPAATTKTHAKTTPDLLVAEKDKAQPVDSPTLRRPRRRRVLFGWRSGGTPTEAPRTAAIVLPSNVIPNHAPAYRCEVCDYFQRLNGGRETEGNGALPTANPTSGAIESDGMREAGSAHSPPCSTAAQGEAEEDAAVGEEEADEDEDVEDHDWANTPASTDIANTIMDDTEVAHLRFQDPFLVEVFGKVSVTRLANRFRKEFQAQLARCHLSAAEMVRRASYVPLRNEQHGHSYETWVESTRQRERGQRRARPPTPMSTSTVSLDTMDIAAYAVRFASAVYGLPFELGYFNSVTEMAKLQADPHRRYTYATSEEQMESMRRMLQGEVTNPLLEFAASSYSVTPNRACYVVSIDHKAHRVVVAFRGSLTLADAILDIREGYVQVDLTNAAQVLAVGIERGALREVQSLKPVKCSPGGKPASASSSSASVSSSTSFSESVATACSPSRKASPTSLSRALIRPRLYQQLVTPLEKLTPSSSSSAHATSPLLTRVPFGFYEAVTDAARTLIPTLRSIHAQYPDYELVLTGHSLGGIEATLFHLLFCFPSQPKTEARGEVARADATSLFRHVQTVTFGSAPVVEARVIPRLQAMLADEERRTGSRMLHFSYGLDIVTRLQVRSIVDLFQPLPDSAEKGETDVGASSGKAQEASATHPNTRPLALPDDAVPTLAIPGHLYTIPHHRRRSCYAVDVDAPWRKELVLTPESVFHHFPTFYVRSVNRVHRARLASAHGHGKRHKNGSSIATATRA